MCEFASLILTKDSEFWGPTESHTDIIEHHKLHEDGARGPNLLRIEITPPPDNPRAPLSEWRYQVDQDQFPEWHIEDPARSEERARLALSRRAACERWMLSEESQSAVVGYGGTATAGAHGTATAGAHGTATAGAHGTATAGYGGTAAAGDDGTATAGDAGTATAGDAGTATAGAHGTATAGYGGTATAGYGGTATAGDDAIIIIEYWDGSRYRVAVGYTGEDGIESGKPYRWDGEQKKLVEKTT